jgi:hypothetical protein
VVPKSGLLDLRAAYPAETRARSQSTYDIEGRAQKPQLLELYDLNVAKARLLTSMRRVFVDNQLDIIISSAYQSCAVPHDTYGVATYTVFCNLFNVR